MKKLLCIIGIIFATTMSTTAFAEMFSFQSVLGVNDISDIQSAVIVGDNGKCADIEQEDLQQWLNVYWDFQGYEPVIIATKLDKIKRSQVQKQIKILKEGLKLLPGTQLIPFSAETKHGRDEIWDVICSFVEEPSDERGTV